MKTPVSRVSTYALVAVVSLLCLPSSTAAQEGKAPSPRTVDGATIFRHYCASCHGADGKGHGPAAATLKVQVPDLTQISKRSEGEFPRNRVRNIIEGIESPVSHGSRTMPIWGPLFHEIDADRDMGHVRVENVTRYIQSLQTK